MIHENSDTSNQFRLPLGFVPGQSLTGLMTLKTFSQGGYDVQGGKIMVCVKSVGAKKRSVSKKGSMKESIQIGVFDDTAEATLTLWGCILLTAARWKPSQTILLISNPGCWLNPRIWISLISNTIVDVDPDVRDAQWLREFAQRLSRKGHVNPEYPDGGECNFILDRLCLT